MSADAAALTVVVVDFGQILRVEFDAGFGAVYPADSAFGAFLNIYCWPECSPRPRFARARLAWTRQRSER